MAILDTVKKGYLTLKTATGYVKLLPRTLASLVSTSDGSDVQTKLDTINNNLTVINHMEMLGTPSGCKATIDKNGTNNYYMKIGNLVFFNVEIFLTNTGTDINTTIKIPCLPYASKGHVAFTTGYQNAVFKANGTDNYTVLKAGAYANSNAIILFGSNGGRTWELHQKELITSDKSVVINGVYAIQN